MAKFIKFTPGPWQATLPAEDKAEGQMLRYLQTKYGNNPADQFEVMTDLNRHQEDGEVVKEKQVRPLSQLFGFKVADWVKNGFVERVTAKALTPKEPGKIARLEAHIADLEGRLRAANLPFEPLKEAA